MQDNILTVKDLTKIRDFEGVGEEYVAWKQQKIEAALQKADEHPDDFLTEKEIWKKHGLEY